MVSKICRRCSLELPAADFGAEKRNADGLRSYCRPCLAQDARDRRADPAVKARIRDYDRRRNATEAVKEAARARLKTAEGRAVARRAQRAHAARNPQQRQAHNALNGAIRSGKVTPWPCEVCGAKAHAHHPHYDAPLLVTWLCPAHHKQAHALIAEAA